MQISIFTDEINRQDPARAIALAAAWGISHVEVRGLSGGRFPSPGDNELEEFQRQVEDAGIAISAVSPGFCKCPVEDPTVPDILASGLPRACQWARQWGTDIVSCFAFRREETGEMPTRVVDHIAEMCAITATHGCRLVLENEAGCWGATGIEAMDLIRQIDDPNLLLCWDPGNAARAGAARPYPDEYGNLRDLVAHVHLKNYDPDNNAWSLLESGCVDWAGQLRALATDGYEGFLVVETHLADSPARLDLGDNVLLGAEANSFRNIEYIRTLLAN